MSISSDPFKRQAVQTEQEQRDELFGTKGRRPTPTDQRINRLQKDVKEASEMMQQNVTLLTEVGERIDRLVDKADAFGAEAAKFKKNASALRTAKKANKKCVIS